MFRRKRRALAVVLVCALFGALTIGAPAARAQSVVEYALIVAQLALLAQDTTPPAITITTPPEGASYARGQVVAADYACTDDGINFMTTIAHQLGFPTLNDFLAFAAEHNSNVAPPTCAGPVASGAPIDTSTPGPHTFTVTATDVAFTVVGGALVSDPNTATATTHYGVAYPFAGFQRPIDNPPLSNQVKAGQAVPIKFSLGGDRGLGILRGGLAPTSDDTGCSNVTGPAVASTAGSSGLQYDAASDTYTWVWKTDKSWAGTCRTLTVALNDNTEQTALFTFR
jgi:hypothetical protein